MRCNFCGSPAAHPSTGCQYGAHTLACSSCVREFWAWVRAHMNKRPRRASQAVTTALTFYEAAGKKP